MATELKDLTVTEISLVDIPANKSARVVLLKRDAPPPVHFEKEFDDMTSTIESVRIVEKALAGGADVQLTKADALAALDLLAKAIQDRAAAHGVTKSFEQAYAEGLMESPTLYEVAVGSTT